MMNELALFNDMMNGLLDGTSCTTRMMGSPNVDVVENKDSYVLDMDLPGRNENDVNITLESGTLTIASVEDKHEEKKERKEEEKTNYLIRERRTTQFTRRFTLPENIDEEGVSAKFTNGVLTITLPKRELPQPKKISIRPVA